jgi:hypothetical protein
MEEERKTRLPTALNPVGEAVSFPIPAGRNCVLCRKRRPRLRITRRLTAPPPGRDRVEYAAELCR